MSDRFRVAMLVFAAAVLAVAAWRVAAALPAFGAPSAVGGQTVNALLPAARRASNMVAAVNFDVRGIDTVGEEAMLVAAVVGAVVLLRGSRGEDTSDRPARASGREIEPRSEATTALCRIGAATTILFGFYMALHGTVTPGGGFQGGAAIATGLLLLYLGDGYATWRRLVRGPLFVVVEGGGALAFAAAALWPLAHGDAALANRLSYGTWKDLFSGGLMVVSNLAVAAAVAGSFALLLLEVMEETRAPKRGRDEQAEETE